MKPKRFRFYSSHAGAQILGNLILFIPLQQTGSSAHCNMLNTKGSPDPKINRYLRSWTYRKRYSTLSGNTACLINEGSPHFQAKVFLSKKWELKISMPVPILKLLVSAWKIGQTHV